MHCCYCPCLLLLCCHCLLYRQACMLWRGVGVAWHRLAVGLRFAVMLAVCFLWLWHTTRQVPTARPLPTPSVAYGMSYILTIVAYRKTAICSVLALASVERAKIRTFKLENSRFHSVPCSCKYGLGYRSALFRSAMKAFHCGTFPGSIEFIYKLLTLVVN